MSTEQARDPRKAEPQPPFPQQQQQAPGSEAELQPQADHGERTYQGHGRLAGKVALITGGDSGIGRAVALAYAREGADVMISYLDEHEDAQATVKLIEEAGRKAEALAGDVQDEEHCRGLVQRAVERFGKLDILVNNAAFQEAADTLEEIPSEVFDRTFRTNVYAMFYLCKAAMPHMQPGASIINTASIQAYDPSESLPPYAATKGAIINFTKSLAKQAMKRGIRVNAVAPGATWTPLIPQTGFPDEKVQQFGKDSVFGRPAQPAELAPVYVLLASDEASYITGEVYGVTGGRTPV
ncbi:MAG TPA: glucose 1-dehydrogenase [Steroidobacteraceae bacterium]|nr:glucose 1-dehydrogenase [Steroidobacteraceae bacterium]